MLEAAKLEFDRVAHEFAEWQAVPGAERSRCPSSATARSTSTFARASVVVGRCDRDHERGRCDDAIAVSVDGHPRRRVLRAGCFKTDERTLGSNHPSPA